MMLDHALGYAARGWPVHPLKARQKLPATQHGVKDATTDAETIRAWWQRWPDANIGIATGHAFDALDVDGDQALAELDPICWADGTGTPVEGPTVRTGRGWQVYLPTTGGGNRAGIVPGVDWRGLGGYVVAPPSTHPSGAAYTWLEDGPTTPLQPMPKWLDTLLEQPTPRQGTDRTNRAANDCRADAYGQHALDSELGRLARAVPGVRNDTLHRSAVRLGQLVAGGHLDPGDVYDQLLLVALRIQLSEDEASATINSGMKFGLGTPRRAS